MNRRLIKEVKALLPAFALTVGLTLAASLLWRGSSALGGCVLLFAVGCTLLGANSFGHEFTSQTMGLLLAQPMSRKRIWYEKMLVLGAALALAFLVLLLCVWFVMDQAAVREFVLAGGESDLGRGAPVFIVKFVCYFVVLGALPLAVFCTAPYWALTARNTFMGVFFVWIHPIATVMIILGLVALCQRLFAWDGSLVARHPFLIPLIALAGFCGALTYCALLYWRGCAALMRFQAAAACPREIALPDRWQDALARPLRKLLPRYTSPVMSLLRKEILLQRPAYVAAAVLCFMALIAAVIVKIHDSEVNRALLAVPLVLCIGVLPLVATGLSVAEERNLGMASWHRTLPPSLRKQWLVKLAVVLGTCVLLGVFLPCLMGVTGWAIGLFPDAHPAPNQPIQWPSFSELLATVSQLLPVCLTYLLLLVIGIFASSVSKTAFRAILLTLALLAGIGATIVLSNWLAFNFTHHVLWPHGVLWPTPPARVPRVLLALTAFGIIDIMLAVGLAMLGTLACLNYRVAEPAPCRAWVQSGIILAVTAVSSVAFWLVLALYGHNL